MRGCADVIAVIGGKFIGIEVKTPKGVLSADQILFQKRLENAGGVYIVARSIADIEHLTNCG